MNPSSLCPPPQDVLPAGYGERTLRRTLFWLSQAFALISLAFFLFEGTVEHVLICLVTPLLLCVPTAAERLLKQRMHTVLYVFCLLYALGPMLGHAYKLYYLTGWWDKMLHGFGGVAFAVAGWQCWMSFCADRDNWFMAAVFAFCLSVSLAALWEFFEFGMDVCFHMDMQRDHFITAIHSYDLGTEMGVLGHMEDIQSVVVNGQTLPGYLDGGLRDTMGDMLWESLGALATSICLGWDKGRRPLFRAWKETKVLA